MGALKCLQSRLVRYIHTSKQSFTPGWHLQTLNIKRNVKNVLYVPPVSPIRGMPTNHRPFTRICMSIKAHIPNIAELTDMFRIPNSTGP